MNYQYESIRKDLIKYYLTCQPCGNPIAMSELGEIEEASHERLLLLARKRGMDVNRYLEEVE